MRKSWQTTLSGLGILAFLAYAMFLDTPRMMTALLSPSVDTAVVGALLAAAIGLLRAADQQAKREDKAGKD